MIKSPPTTRLSLIFFAVVVSLLVLVLLGFLFPPKPHIILIGLDGVPPEIVQDMMARGELPNLARIADRGAFGKLHTHKFSHTRLVWPIIYTGVGPERNGISVDTAAEFEKIAITPSMRKVPALWDVVASNGGRSSLITLYESFPAERQDNVLETSDRIWNLPNLEDSPEGAFSSAKVRSWALTRMKWALENPWILHDLNYIFTDAGYNATTSNELSHNRTVTAMLRTQLIERMRRDILCVKNLGCSAALRNNDLLVVYFQGTDISQHVYNDSKPPEKQTLGRRKIEVILRIYDAALGNIIESSPPGSYVCVVSDHGFDLAPEYEVFFGLGKNVTTERINELVAMAKSAQAHGKMLFTHVEERDGGIALTLNESLVGKEVLSALNLLRNEPELHAMSIGYSANHEAAINRDLPTKYDPELTPPAGIFFLSGPGIQKANKPFAATIYDVAPTLVYALGLSVASDLDGTPLLDLFSSGWVKAHPMQTIPAFAPRKENTTNLKMDNSARLNEMRGLGYIDE